VTGVCVACLSEGWERINRLSTAPIATPLHGRFPPLGTSLRLQASRPCWTNQTSTQGMLGATGLTPSSTLAPRSESRESEEEVSRATTPGPRRTQFRPGDATERQPTLSQQQAPGNTRFSASPYPQDEDNHSAPNTKSPPGQSVLIHARSHKPIIHSCPPYTYRKHLELHLSRRSDTTTKTDRLTAYLKPSQPCHHSPNQSHISLTCPCSDRL
jgi:hypothetical protein